MERDQPATRRMKGRRIQNASSITKYAISKMGPPGKIGKIIHTNPMTTSGVASPIKNRDNPRLKISRESQALRWSKFVTQIVCPCTCITDKGRGGGVAPAVFMAPISSHQDSCKTVDPEEASRSTTTQEEKRFNLQFSLRAKKCSLMYASNLSQSRDVDERKRYRRRKDVAWTTWTHCSSDGLEGVMVLRKGCFGSCWSPCNKSR
jgi:hypothetical protein